MDSVDPLLYASVQEAMTSATLSRYFRAFLVKLSMVESQLGPLEPQGSCPALSIWVICAHNVTDDVSFAILLELCDDNEAPTGPQDEMAQDPPPWVPADGQYTTSGTPDDVQLHLLRVVETGIVNVSLMYSATLIPFLTKVLAFSRCTGIRRETQKAEEIAQEK